MLLTQLSLKKLYALLLWALNIWQRFQWVDSLRFYPLLITVTHLVTRHESGEQPCKSWLFSFKVNFFSRAPEGNNPICKQRVGLSSSRDLQVCLPPGGNPVWLTGNDYYLCIPRHIIQHIINSHNHISFAGNLDFRCKLQSHRKILLKRAFKLLQIRSYEKISLSQIMQGS